MAIGYSGTPLAKKLGVRVGQNAWQSGMPASVLAEIEAEEPSVIFSTAPEPPLDFAYLFTRSRSELEETLVNLRKLLAPTGIVWVSWPKKLSKVPTDITEDVIREVAIPMGFVDIKVCAVNATWSGLKLVVRKSLR